MHTTSKSLKVTIGAIAIAAAALGLTACGGGSPAKKAALSLMPGSSSVQLEVGNALK